MTNAESSELFSRLIDEAQAHGGGGWRPVSGESPKITKDWRPEFILSPRDHFAGGGFGLEAWDYFPGVRTPTELIERSTAAKGKSFAGAEIPSDRLSPKFEAYRAYVERYHTRYLPVFDKLSYDPADLGGPRARIDWFRDQDGPAPVSFSSMAIAVRVAVMRECLDKYQSIHKLPKDARIVEIGGGFGQLLTAVSRARHAQMVAVDLPANLIATHYYLEKQFPGQVGRLWFDEDRYDPDKRYPTVAPWKMSELPRTETLAINFRSFQHMDRTNHEFYSDALKGIGCQAVYHSNRNMVRDAGDLVLDEYPLREWCDPISRCAAPLDLNKGYKNGQEYSLYIYEELLVRR